MTRVRGRRATLPMPDIEAGRPAASPASSLPFATLHLEDAHNYVFDLSTAAGPPELQSELVIGVERWCADYLGGRRRATVYGVRTALRRWLRWVEVINETTQVDPILRVQSVTPFHLRAFANELEQTHTKSVAAGYYADLCRLLQYCDSLPAPTRHEARKRKQYVAHLTMVERYAPQDFVSLRNAARRTVEAAHARIAASMKEIEDLLHTDRPAETTRQQALLDLLLHGSPRTRAGYASLGAATGSDVNNSKARLALFLTGAESTAAAVLLVCQRGLNLSPVLTARAPTFHGDLAQLDLDKPRRGPRGRFWPEILGDVPDEEEPSAVQALQMIVEATEPARIYLENQGTPTDRLLIRWSAGSAQPKFGIPASDKRDLDWMPAGVPLSFRRLRRSVPGQGVSKEPTDHDPATYLRYVLTDPVALVEEQVRASEGIAKARARARLEVETRIRASERSKEERDALIVSCSDPSDHPVTHRPCERGFYSFLDCLDCDNATTANRLLPRQMAALEVLESLRGGMGSEWDTRFSRYFYMLEVLVARHTADERRRASEQAQATVPLILAALRRTVPS